MKRAIWVQETRAMKFEQTQSEWEAGRLTQEEAAQILGICERSFEPSHKNRQWIPLKVLINP